MIPFRANGTHYKITGQELIPVKIWINSDARVFLAPFVPFDNSWLFLLLLRNLWHYPWPSLPLFFTSLNFCKLEQFLLLSMLQSNSCYFCKFCEIGGPQEVALYLYSVAKFVILATLVSFFLSYSIFSHSKKKSCYFCDFCEIRGLLEALLGLLSF